MKKLFTAWPIGVLMAFAAMGAIVHQARATQMVKPAMVRAAVPAPQTGGNPCGGTITHCVILDWQASPSQATCTSTATPPCGNFTYNVMAGTTPGGEAATPIGSTSTLTYTYPVTLTSTAQTFYFTVTAQETVTEANGTVTAVSAPSNEASGTFPSRPAAPSAGATIN